MELIVGRVLMETVVMTIVAVALLLSPSFTTTNAYDPSPSQNICVADNNASVHVNGKVCKDPKLVTVDDFLFSGLQIGGDREGDTVKRRAARRSMAGYEGGKGKKTIVKLETEDDVAVAVAKYTAHLSEKFIARKGSISVVLSGGSLIDTMRYLTEPPYKGTVDWSKWSIFWVDERVVPLSSDDSNYKLAYDGFFSKVSIPSEAIYAINDKLLEPDSAAQDYEHRIKDLVGENILPSSQEHHQGFPKFDLMLLGMGPDGHVASLFPNRTQKFEMRRWVTYITDSPKPPPHRITFTFPVINAATEIAMVVTGPELAHAVKEVLGTENSDLPAAKVRAQEELTWFLDKDASSLLLLH